ncbi:uncharacterized protein LOC110717467 [Chenopodium quinoa]|uniref:uncharacterized protein LOC110717467 n=1 Tax=Chenopodium quinoa TaxID=63459 RepID=UPI000B7827FE|nr:uncharacterized protein LOC110717467 [Chenopodium quinoa]XP_021751870.1 uncharacterized protein LOC110717467 [Chenopodium quinoa]XP_021751871.1 uncharacterized protein LOC110717467 [Chenopodium quinoa]XP_021751872.1 uncharacterized protein LOC110717467 [Chenopodium quinoa]XP_021751873.1 uncharacterized protein LOC110717467 [Chenopodium quinoa]XP_021751874.1 uncharacterized protein LOC110717467 [Chenopodium quinoa]
MLREATERIANDFVNLSNLLRLGERFHTTPLVEETTIYNVKAMWSKCAGAKLPSEIQQPTQNQRVEGASILSQDTDFFASDWFGNIIDDVVKNVVMNDGVQPEDVNGRQQEYEGIWKTPPTAQVDEPSFELRLQVDDVDKVFSDPMSDIEKTVFSDPKSDIEKTGIHGKKTEDIEVEKSEKSNVDTVKNQKTEKEKRDRGKGKNLSVQGKTDDDREEKKSEKGEKEIGEKGKEKNEKNYGKRRESDEKERNPAVLMLHDVIGHNKQTRFFINIKLNRCFASCTKVSLLIDFWFITKLLFFIKTSIRTHTKSLSNSKLIITMIQLPLSCTKTMFKGIIIVQLTCLFIRLDFFVE